MRNKIEAGQKKTMMRFLCLPTTRPLDADVYICSCDSKCKSYCATLCVGSYCRTFVCHTLCTSKCDTYVPCTGECSTLM